MCSDKSTVDWPYSALGLSEFPKDQKEIKRAYARKLKTIDQSTQAEEFQELRAAFEAAKNNFAYEQGNQSDEPAPYLEAVSVSAPSTPQLIEPEEATIHGEADGEPLQLDQLEDERPVSNRQFTSLELTELEQPALAGHPVPLPATDDFDPQTLYALESKIADLSKDKTGVTFLLELLGSPIMEEPEARPRIETALYRYLQQCLTVDAESHPKFRLFVSKELLDAAELHFNWQTDVFSLQRKFWDSEEFVAALLYDTIQRHTQAEAEEEGYDIGPVGRAVVKLALGGLLLNILNMLFLSSFSAAKTIDLIVSYCTQFIAIVTSSYLIYRVGLLIWEAIKYLLKPVIPSLKPQREWGEILSFSSVGLLFVCALSLRYALPENTELHKYALATVFFLTSLMIALVAIYFIFSVIFSLLKKIYFTGRALFTGR